MSNLVHNERMKMMATLYNNLAVGSIMTGIIVAWISAAAGVNVIRGNSVVSFLEATVSVFFGFGLGYFFVGNAQRMLNNLREM